MRCKPGSMRAFRTMTAHYKALIAELWRLEGRHSEVVDAGAAGGLLRLRIDRHRALLRQLSTNRDEALRRILRERRGQ